MIDECLFFSVVLFCFILFFLLLTKLVISVDKPLNIKMELDAREHVVIMSPDGVAKYIIYENTTSKKQLVNINVDNQKYPEGRGL